MNAKRKHLSVILLLIVCILCTSAAYTQKLPFTNYNTANGLTHNRTHVVRQDGKGYIWIGTDLGINRYDGRSFRHFPCPENAYRSARYATRNGTNVVFSVDHYGIAICCGDSVKFIKLNTEKRSSINGTVCIGDSTFYLVNLPYGLFSLKNGIAKHIDLHAPFVNKSDFSDIYKDRQGNLWLLSAEGLLFAPKADLASLKTIPFFNGRYVSAIREDANGDLYIACHKAVFRYSNIEYNRIMNVIPETIVTPEADLTGIAFDNNGNVWLSNTFKGLYKYNKDTRTINNYGIGNGLVSQNLWDVFCDKENNIWVASENGISKLTTQNYLSYDFTNTDYQSVKSACVINDSTLLFTNLLDAYMFRHDSISKIRGYKNVPGYIEDLFMKTNENGLFANINLMINSATFNVVTYHYEMKDNTLVKGKQLTGLPGNIEYVSIEQGAAKINDEIWVNSDKGMELFKNDRFYSVPGFTNNDKKVIVTYIAGSAQGNLWLISNHRDLIRYKINPSNTDSFPYILEQQQYISAGKLGGQYFSKIFIDGKGSLWLCGREKGMCLLHTNNDGNVTRIDTFAAGTFSSGVINDVAEDDEHNIWVGTASGLDKVVYSKDSFNIEKDVYGNELCGKYIFFVKKLQNKLLLGTSGCMGVISIGRHEAVIAPEVYISGIKVNERNEPQLLSTTPEFKPHENSISFTFTGISFKDEHHIKYSYQLEGLDKKWSDPQTEYTITYSHIPPGNYTFKVKALSANGVWSALPANFTFTIAQPFYTMWWFAGLVIIVISAIVYSIYRYRINQLLEIQNIRQSISKDLHDDIGATVSSINILANMAKSDFVSESKRNSFLESILSESKHVSESLNDIVWNINPKNDSLDIVFARMQRYASELFEARDIAYQINLPLAPVNELSIDMKRRQHVFLIFKEAVNNLIKYADATKAEINLSVSNSEFRITISDNGKGFDANKEYSGNGIFNMTKRAKDINARLTIKSVAGKGTNILLILPF